MAKPYVKSNNVQSDIAAGNTWQRGTDTSIVLTSGTNFDSGGGYIRIGNADSYAIMEYTGKSTHTLTGLTACTIGVVVSVGDETKTWPAATVVKRVSVGEDFADANLPATLLRNVVEDTTPQLGGSLDVNGNSIVSASNGNIPITPNGTGQTIISAPSDIVTVKTASTVIKAASVVIAVDGDAETYTLSAGTWTNQPTVGERIYVTGFTTPANNGVKTVTVATTTVITVSENLTTEAEGDTINIVAALTTAEAGTVLVSAAGAYTLYLPACSGNTGLRIHFVKTDANYNAITLSGNGTETFNYENATGAPVTTYPRLNTYCAEVTVVSDGTNWQVMNEQIGLRPKFYAYRNANQTGVVTATDTKITLNDEVDDIGGNFDKTTNNRFTAPIAGDYIFLGSYRVDTPVADKTYGISIVVDATTSYGTSRFHSASTGPIQVLTGVQRLTLTAAQTVELRSYHTQGTDVTVAGDASPNVWNTYLHGYLLAKG